MPDPRYNDNDTIAFKDSCPGLHRLQYSTSTAEMMDSIPFMAAGDLQATRGKLVDDMGELVGVVVDHG